MIKGKCNCGKKATGEYMIYGKRSAYTMKWCNDCAPKYRTNTIVLIYGTNPNSNYNKTSIMDDKANNFPEVLISPWGTEYEFKSTMNNEARYEGFNEEGKRHTLIYSQALERYFIPGIKRKDLLKEYQELINKTAIYPKEIGIGYCSLGLAGEAGEIANKVKKMYRDKNLLEYERIGGIYPVNAPDLIDEFNDDMKAELGDVMWYVTALAQEFGLTLEEIMEYNMTKLLGRRERGTLQGSGDNR